MTGNDMDVDFRNRIYNRALEEQNSNLWNFKRYYTAASFWSAVDVGTDAYMALAGAVITYGLAWRTVPVWIMATLSLSVAAISIFKGNRKPGKRAEKIHTLGRNYQKLYDEIQDFIELDLKDNDREKEWIRDRFDKLASERHDLKAEATLSGIWYRWLKLRRGDEIYEEAATTDKERDLLDPEGFEQEDSEGDDES
ncbi:MULTISPECIES: hypothetical protein [unclassified Haloferax]|uniref:hypothetical protein n=1 Tax=unclassified Haloferax TaxID=2625095 RepID=UPI0028759F68|nr:MULTISPECIES: hypothetical protein [unclassified Haloferax]MDS0243604.1 hypothetical protein [Haloferax sp. S2CR25]MDS0446725.1 hypothetical protein [Haloferax sp. S2CR25-2]